MGTIEERIEVALLVNIPITSIALLHSDEVSRQGDSLLIEVGKSRLHEGRRSVSLAPGQQYFCTCCATQSTGRIFAGVDL